MGFCTSAVFILLLPFLVFNSLKNRGSGRSCQGKITTTACYFLPPQIFLCLCLLSFLWLTCFFSCLLNIPGYEHTMRESWPRILQTLKFNLWFYPSGVSPRTIKLIKNFLSFFSAAVIDSGRRNLFTPPVLYFPSFSLSSPPPCLLAGICIWRGL